MPTYYGNPIIVGGGGVEEFNATFVCPPYCHIYGTCTTSAGETEVSWDVADFTEFEVTLVKNATYVLKCDVEVPFQTTRKTLTASEISFQTGTTLGTYSFIPADAIFFFGWENPDFTRQTVYYTGGTQAAAAGSNVHRSGNSSSTSVWPAAQVSLMQLNKQDHCYDGNLNLYNGSMGNCLAYNTPVSYKTKRYLNCWSHLYWSGESSTSTSTLLRYDYHAQGNNANPSSTYSDFWAAAVGSGNHTDVTYAQVYNQTIPSGGSTFLSFIPRSTTLEAKGFIDLNSISYSNTNDVRFRFMLRTNTMSRLNTAYYKIYVVTYSDSLYVPPAVEWTGTASGGSHLM